MYMRIDRVLNTALEEDAKAFSLFVDFCWTFTKTSIEFIIPNTDFHRYNNDITRTRNYFLHVN